MGSPYQQGNPEEPRWEQQQSYPPPPNYSQQPPGYPSQPPGYPSQPGYPAQQGYGAPGYGVDPQAPYGRDPATGQPLSDKSATTAGLLQLFFGSFGVGRFYLESTQIAAIQLCLGVVGLAATIFLCGIGLPIYIGVCVWALVDAIMIFQGSVPDQYGRKLHK